MQGYARVRCRCASSILLFGLLAVVGASGLPPRCLQSADPRALLRDQNSDVRARLPALNILTVVALIAAAGFFLNAFYRARALSAAGFSNRNPPTHHRYKRITPASLCACSALPLIEQTVEIDGDIYCEGALVDTVNFEDLIEDHPDLDEIWISRIVDAGQILPPKNILDSTANLCELFAATVGEDDVKLFKYHVKDAILKSTGAKWTGTIIEIQVERNINFEWSHSNLENGRHKGREAVDRAYKRYTEKIQGKQDGQLLIIEPTPDRKRGERKSEKGPLHRS